MIQEKLCSDTPKNIMHNDSTYLTSLLKKKRTTEKKKHPKIGKTPRNTQKKPCSDTRIIGH